MTGQNIHNEQHHQPEVPAQKYSVFTQTEKWCIVTLVAFAAWFSTLSSFIYYPALDQLASYFSVSVDKINLWR